MFRLCVLLFLIHTTFCGLFGRSKNVKTLKNMDQIQKVLTQNSIVSVFFYNGKNCENCGNAWNLIEKIADDNEGVFKVYDIDCDELWSDQYSHSKYYLCDPSTRNQLPQVTFYKPPTQKINPYTKQPMEPTEHRFSGEASPKALSQFGHKLLPAFRIKINNTEDYEDFLQKEPKLNKVILFTEKKITAAIYKGLSIHYYKRLYFGEVVETPENNDLLDEFEIEEFPQVFMLLRNEDGSYTRELYEGDVIWDRLVKYLDKYAAPEPVELEHPEIFEPPEETVSDKKRRRREQQQQEQQKKKEEKEEKEKPKFDVKNLTKEIFEKTLLKTEKPSLVHIFKDKVHPQWEEAQKKYRSLFDYYSYKVTNEEDELFAKSELSVGSKLPVIRFFAVGTPQKKRATKVVFNEQMTFDEMQKDIQDLIDDKSINVNDKELQYQLQSGLQEGKALIILFYNTPTVSLTFRIFSSLSEYSGKFKFITFKNAPENILQQFQIRSQPQIVSVFRDVPKDKIEEPLKNEEIKIANFQGKIIYHEVLEFLKMFDEDLRKSSTLKKIVEIHNQDDLEDICTKKATSCFIGLLNGQHKNQSQTVDQTKWEYQMEVMEKIKDKFGQRPVTFAYIDASCHDELLVPFEISDDFLPNYVHYSSSKKQYAKLIGMFDQESIGRFIENFFKGRTAIFNLQNELQIQEKNCVEVYEQRLKASQSANSSDEEDDILKEILEEERRKKEQIEKELKAEKKKNKKKKNKQDKEEL